MVAGTACNAQTWRAAYYVQRFDGVDATNAAAVAAIATEYLTGTLVHRSRGKRDREPSPTPSGCGGGEALADGAGPGPGFQWTLYYYHRGVPSWQWAYEHHYAPLLHDAAAACTALAHQPPKFTLGAPLLPLEQLISVLPPASAQYDAWAV